MKSYNRVLVKLLQEYDGLETLADWTVDTDQLVRARQLGANQAIYQRLLSHAVSIGLNVNIVPENSKLIVTVNIRIEERLSQDEDKLKLYVHLCRWYSGRFHENKFRGQYEDPIYGTHSLYSVRKLARLVDQVDIELIQTGEHLTVNIKLDSFITDLNI